MASIQTFEEIEAWKKGRELAAAIYRLTESGKMAADFVLRDQLRRAAVSVVSNLAEGFERRGDREFRRFLRIAKASTGEIRAQMYVALDAGLVDRSDFDRVHQAAFDAGRLIGGFINYLERCHEA